MDAYAPVRGKCVWWREVPNSEDIYNLDVKEPDKRWDCSCFVEGFQWTFPLAEVPVECPKSNQCRYFVRGY